MGRPPILVLMKIKRVIWYLKFIKKIKSKHRVEIGEAEEALQNRKRIRRIKRGHVKGENIYLALGRTDTGRYLAVFFIL